MYATKNTYWIVGKILFIESRSATKDIFRCDAEDADLLLQYTWHTSTKGYLRCTTRKDKQMYAHQLLMNFPANMEIDHKDGDSKNNRRGNLRIVTRAQNQQNQVRAKGWSYRGDMFPKPYVAKIRVGKKQYHLGYYTTAEEAHEAYLRGKVKHHPDSPMIRNMYHED